MDRSENQVRRTTLDYFEDQAHRHTQTTQERVYPASNLTMVLSSQYDYMRTSQIRPPSRIPSPGKALFEVSESQNNARPAPASMMPPPATLKHKATASCKWESRTSLRSSD